MNVVEVPLGKIVLGENHRVRTENTDVKDLMASIKQDGLLQAVGVVKNGAKYELVYGNRRFNAVKKLGIKSINCHVLKLKKDEDKLIVNLVENQNREDVTVVEAGLMMVKLIEKYNLGESELAVRLGVSRGYIRNYLNVANNVPREFRKLITNKAMGKSGVGKIPLVKALAILSYTSGGGRGKRAELNKLYRFAAGGETLGSVRKIGSLIQAGATFESAAKKVGKVERFGIEMQLSTKDKNRLVKEYGVKKLRAKMISIILKDKTLNIRKV